MIIIITDKPEIPFNTSLPEIKEEFCTTAYLRGDPFGSLVNINEMKVMQSFLKDLTDLLVTASFFSKSFISVVALKPTLCSSDCPFLLNLFCTKNLRFLIHAAQMIQQFFPSEFW